MKLGSVRDPARLQKSFKKALFYYQKMTFSDACKKARIHPMTFHKMNLRHNSKRLLRAIHGSNLNPKIKADLLARLAP